MEIAKMTSKGQITVPKAVREKLDLGPGDKVLFVQRGNEVVVSNAESTARRIEEDSSVYRFTPDSMAAFRQLQEAYEGLAEELGLTSDDDVVRWLREDQVGERE